MRHILASTLFLAACTPGELTSPPATRVAADAAAKGDPTQPPCATPTLYVREKAKPGGDGSKKAPYRRISDALSAAKPLACPARIEIAEGNYLPEAQSLPLALTFAVTLSGTGDPVIGEGISIETAEPVTIEDVTIANAVGTGIRVNHTKANVRLLRVAITDASQYGLWQNGGTLSALGLEISGTRSDKHPSTGTAIVLSGGVRAVLTILELHDNPRALYATGDGTSADIGIMDVRNSSYHPDVPGTIAARGCGGMTINFLGAVEFANGARGTGNAWTITRSYLAGIYAHDDASVTVTNIRVRETDSVAGGSDSCGGYGLFAYRGGRMDVTGFYIAHSTTCGVAVGSGAGSALDLHGGAIAHSPVGACVQLEGFDANRLRDAVEFRHVGVALTATSYPLPELP